jgi:hypothetical protein
MKFYIIIPLVFSTLVSENIIHHFFSDESARYHRIVSNAKDFQEGVVALQNPIHHYIYFGNDREKINDSLFLHCKKASIAQIRYPWKMLKPGKTADGRFSRHLNKRFAVIRLIFIDKQ